MYELNAELYHYGVPGMKWGKRKAKSDYRSAKRAARQTYRKSRNDRWDSDYKTKLDYQKGNISRYDMERSNLQSHKKSRSAAAKKSTDIAKAKMDYKIAKGKDATKAKERYKKVKNSNDRYAKSLDRAYVKDLAKRDPKVAQKLSDKGHIPVKDLDSVMIEIGLETVSEIMRDAKKR